MDEEAKKMLQIGIKKGSVTKKVFDNIIDAFKKNKEDGQENLEKVLKKVKKGRPGAIALDVTKEELDAIMESTLANLFISENEEARLR